MGSRKKKKIIPRFFVEWWRSISPNDRIAFKCLWWFWGRGRRRLHEFFTMPEIIGSGHNRTLYWNSLVQDGYSWMHDKDKYRPISYYDNSI